MPNTTMPNTGCQSGEAFWLVWREGGTSPFRKHKTFEAARVEADRLANLGSGRTFYVLQATWGCAAPKPGVLSWPLVTVSPSP